MKFNPRTDYKKESDKMNKQLFTPGIRILWFVLSMLCFLYSVMVFMVNSGTFSFIIWLAGAVFFSLCYFLAGKGRWSGVPAGIRYMCFAVMSVVALTFITCQIAILSHFFDKGERDLDYIIVLGAQMRADGPSVIYSYRLQKAAEYLNENPGTICITTGAQGNNEPVSEGDGGAKYLLSIGVAENRIITETQSMDTEENIKNSLAIIDEHEERPENLRIGIVTNGFHVFRGIHIAGNLTDADISGIAAYMQPQYIPNNMVRETFGILRDLLRGRLV